MKRPILQSAVLQIVYKGIFLWFLRIFIGVRFGDNGKLKSEKQFIIIANHNSHLDTISLLASLPRKMLWKVKPVAAEDYFGNTKLKAKLSNFFINTLLISRVVNRERPTEAIDKMIEALDEGYSLILFPEGTRGSELGQMGKMKPGIARVLAKRPLIKYVPIFMTGMGRLLPKGEVLLLPHKASVNFGEPSLAKSDKANEIMAQIEADFEAMRAKYQPVNTGK